MKRAACATTILLLFASVSTTLAQKPPTTKPGPPPSGPSPWQQLPGPNGAARGSVVDDTGKPVPYARVFISQALAANVSHPAAPPVITGPHMTSAMTDGSGQFTAFLPPGSYVACAQTRTPGLLDPCHVATSAPTFSVAKGQVLTGVKVVMARGAVLSIHVNDPQGLLAVPSAAIADDCRFQIVTAKGYPYEAAITAHSATGRDHAITVPFGAAVTVRVISPHLVVHDSTGKPAAGAGASVAIPAAGSPGGLTFTVAGVKP